MFAADIPQLSCDRVVCSLRRPTAATYKSPAIDMVDCTNRYARENYKLVNVGNIKLCENIFYAQFRLER